MSDEVAEPTSGAPSEQSDAVRVRLRWFFRLSLRVRLIIVGVTGVAVALAVGSTTLYTVLSVAMNNTLDAEAHASASDVAALVDRGPLPDPLPVSGAQVVQIIDPSHRVLNGSVNADRLTPLLHPDEIAQALRGDPVTVPGNRAGLSGPLRVSAERAGPGGAPVTILVAVQVADLQHSLDALRNALLITSPILLALLAVIAWFVIGWTLRPVEALRRGAERISGTGRAERLPVPDAADEISALARTLNQMLDRLAAARDRQRAFVADAAHELRSPLASIRVQLEVAQRLGEAGTATADLLTDVDRLTRLVDDLLLLARADADTRGPARPTVFDGQALIEEIGRFRADADGVAVRVRPGPPVRVRADRNEIHRAVSNLVDNAVRHAAGVVDLAVTVTDGDAVFRVVDDGPGIPAADREKVFERFTRLDDARDRDAGGTGLGLSIVRELARRAGGSVTLQAASENADNPGLDARLHLPAGTPTL